VYQAGLLFGYVGKYDRAYKAFDRARQIRIAEARSDPRKNQGLGVIELYRATVALLQGCPELAQAAVVMASSHIVEFQRVMRQVHIARDEIHLDWLRIEIQLQQENEGHRMNVGLEDEIFAVLVRTRRHGYVQFEADMLLSLGKFYLMKRQLFKAGMVLEQALTICNDMGYRLKKSELLLLQAQLFHTQKDERAYKHTLSLARTEAFCDGEPFVYRSVLERISGLAND
jgi:tetratricopeptide (TPR) repeat protein